MRLKIMIILMFTAISLLGATDSLSEGSNSGIIYFASLIGIFIFLGYSNSRIEKTKNEIQRIDPILNNLNSTLQSMMEMIGKMNDTLQTLQSEKMIYANKNQIVNIVKTNLDLTEAKLYMFSCQQKSFINHSIEQTVEQKTKFKQTITSTIKFEKNILINNIKLFKYSQVNIDDLLELIISIDDISNAINSYIFSDKDNPTFKLELNSVFNEIYNKFAV